MTLISPIGGRTPVADAQNVQSDISLIIKIVGETYKTMNIDRPALLLGVLGKESDFGTNLGSNMGSPAKNIARCENLSDDPNWCAIEQSDLESVVSSATGLIQQNKTFNDVPITSDYGMGDAQFEPSTWMLFNKLSYKNPWDPADAVLALELKLSESDINSAPFTALEAYNGSGLRAYLYAEAVLNKATTLESALFNPIANLYQCGSLTDYSCIFAHLEELSANCSTKECVENNIEIAAKRILLPQTATNLNSSASTQAQPLVPASAPQNTVPNNGVRQNSIPSKPASVPVATSVAQLSDDATLSNLTVNGHSVENFSSGVLSYSIQLPLSVNGPEPLPVVSAAANDPHATLKITQATALPGTATVAVTAENGATETYMVNFTVSNGYAPSLASLSVSVPQYEGSNFTIVVGPNSTGKIVGDWLFTAENNPVILNSVTFHIVSSANISAIRNVKLTVNSGNGAAQVGAAVPVIGQNGMISFNFQSSPVTLSPGVSELQLTADIAGSPGTSFQFKIASGGDVSVSVLSDGSYIPVPVQDNNGTSFLVEIAPS